MPSNLELILDSALIPSLPGPGGKLGHRDLVPTQHRSAVPAASWGPSNNSHSVPASIIRPAQLPRARHATTDRSHNHTPPPASRGDRRTASNGQDRGADTSNGSLHSIRNGNSRTTHRKNPRPSSSLVINSAPTLSPVPLGQADVDLSSACKLSASYASTFVLSAPILTARSGSEYTLQAHTPSPRRHDQSTNSLPAGNGIDASDLALTDLIPPSRLKVAKLASDQDNGSALILLALGHVLELLIYERALLQLPNSGSKPPQPPPALTGSAPFASPHGLSWTQTARHMSILSGILVPALGEMQQEGYSREVEMALEAIKAYIGKIRKVFLEVTALYTESYSFVTGMWDDGGMRSAAQAVGEWSDALSQ